MTQVFDKPLSHTVDEAIKRLVSAEHFRAGSIVSMPVMYPSGASVVLEILSQAGRIFITDRGGAYQEAEFAGATRTFSREAEKVAADAGIKFDGRDMFVAEVPVDRVDGAMVVVAACSAQAAAITALRAAERDEKFAKEALFDKLTDVFGINGFERDAKLVGASNHSWRVDAIVRHDSSLAIFNSVTKRYISAAGTAAKFHDLARLEFAPKRVAVVSSKTDIGDWYGVISSASDAILEMGAANDQFFQLGAAA
jgi:hypothetical protein